LRLYLLIFDLEAIFNKQLYVHPGFIGKTSIKNVLPVICPDLSYKTLNIGDGQTVAIRRYHMATHRHAAAECQNIYAKTFANTATSTHWQWLSFLVF
jgi:hypothetical protein